MAITQSLCTSFKSELMSGLHVLNSTGNTFKCALYTSSATIDGSTTAYTTASEITGTGYVAGGETVTVPSGYPTSSGTTAFIDFNDVAWTGATFTAAGALIYNSTNSNRSVCVLDFGGNQSVASGTFTIQFPTPNSANAIIRIA